MSSATANHLIELLSAQLTDCETHWSLGTFGALAEFSHDRREAVAISRDDTAVSAVTDRGGIRISTVANLRLFASESVTRDNWNHRVALCLPQRDCAMMQRNVLTEVGSDNEALRADDRGSILFDLGLGALQVDACIRLSDAAVIAKLRQCAGRNVFEAANPAMPIILEASPNRVFAGRVGRIEVFQPIPPPNGRSPEGPHTHVLPKLLQHGRTHAATEPMPEGFVPCAHFYPAHPTKDANGQARPFDLGRHSHFQRMLAQYGDTQTVALKRQLMSAIEQGTEPSPLAPASDRFARASIRVALRQLQALSGPSPTLAAWLRTYDHVHPAEADDADAMHAH